ncbi:Gamma Purothionin [Vigna unguiculata]|uniref:Gamma Purothionin n=1 Tax=Vigna unguiculata TaxID=3917 RepID=A0A4D6L940_VIGUN|nr:Gamma Purothionin [Vigna unguiculata]
METKVLRFTMFLLFLVLAADVAVKRTEARECWTSSRTFKGLCFSSSNCEAVCFTEGFSGGKCKGVRHKCYCSEICRN